MLLGEFLLEVGRNYVDDTSMDSYAQRLLRSAGEHVGGYAPAGFAVIGSGGKGRATFTPWVGFFDPDEASSPGDGLYVVYIFDQSMNAVSVTLNQGITKLRSEVGLVNARNRLSADAAAVRSRLSYEPEHFTSSLTLSSRGARQSAYEAGNILARRYELADLSMEANLQADLATLLTLYGDAIAAKRDLLQTEPGVISSASSQRANSKIDVTWNFKPKSDTDYIAHLNGRALRKSRRHEAIVRDFGLELAHRGFLVATNQHPRDLVAERVGHHWLIEAKVLYQGNATDAVRAAVGQLLSYRHFLYRAGSNVSLLALFSEPVGEAYVRFLDSIGISCVWFSDGKWEGSSSAQIAGLVESS